VIDRARFPRDKPCGEGLMPPGVEVLRRLDLLDAVLATGAQPLNGVTYTHLGGKPTATAAFPTPPGGGPSWGLGVRRLRFDDVLAQTLRAEPRVAFLESTRALEVMTGSGGVTGVRTDGAGTIDTTLVVAADGLHSPMRAAAGWTSPPRASARYGLAGHWRVDTRRRSGITVTFAGDHEWYEAAVGPEELLVSVLASRSRLGVIARDYAAAAQAALPSLRDAELSAEPLSAGQFHQRPGRIASGGLFLVGDAAGYDDPTTGEGLGVGMQLGECLARRLGSILDGSDAVEEASRAYTRDHHALLRDRRRLTRLALLMASKPLLSRRAVARAAERPETLSRLLGINCGYRGFGSLSPRDWLALAGI
jgi:2-polyprenyl-6-methoxyphenol hydroxylase-like FAD-dependent oxidoreductase